MNVRVTRSILVLSRDTIWVKKWNFAWSDKKRETKVSFRPHNAICWIYTPSFDLVFYRRNLACACNIVFPCLVVWYVILDNMTYVYVYGILLSLTNLLLSLKPREDAANAVTGIEEFLINVDKKNSEAGSASPTQKSCDDDVTIDDEEKRVRFQFIWIFRVYIVNVVMYVCVELCNLLITTEKKNIFISLFFTDNRQQWNNTNFHWLS